MEISFLLLSGKGFDWGLIYSSHMCTNYDNTISKCPRSTGLAPVTFNGNDHVSIDTSSHWKTGGGRGSGEGYCNFLGV